MTDPIECSTLQYYENHAMEFSSGTIVADMRNARSRFLILLQPGTYILDLAVVPAGMQRHSSGARVQGRCG